MTAILPFIALAANIFTGWCMVNWLWPRRAQGSEAWLIFFISACVGLGTGSLGSFIWRIALWWLPLGFVLIDVALLVTFTTLWRLRSRSEQVAPVNTNKVDDTSHRGASKYLLAMALGLAIVCATTVFRTNQVHPHGQWDAQAIWNVKAKFLLYGQAQWTNMFAAPVARSDYPLLLPLTIARLWSYQGYDSTIVPQVLTVTWLLTSIGLIVTSLSVLAGVRHAALATLILLTSKLFLELCSWQYADTAMSMFILAALGTVALWRPQNGQTGRLLILAGFCAGCAAWTKNEGLLFALALAIAFIVATTFTHGSRTMGHGLKYLLLGMAPMICLVVFFKLAWSGPSDLFADQNIDQMLTHLIQPDRHRLVWKSMFDSLDRILHVPLMLLAVLYTLLVGIHRTRTALLAPAVAAIATLIMVVGYAGIYLITPHDLQWHLSTSNERLLLQLWPGVVLMIFLLPKPPESLRLVV